MWESFTDNFRDFTDTMFKKVNKEIIINFRIFLQDYKVLVKLKLKETILYILSKVTK